MNKKLLFTLFLVLVQTVMIGATIISKSTGGNWNDPNTWVGNVVPNSTDDVTISAGSTVTFANTPITIMSLAVNGILNLLPDNNTINTSSIIITAPGMIVFDKKSDLTIPENATLQVGEGGLDGACSNTNNIFIGAITYAYCVGGGNPAIHFDDLMALGGSASATSNSPVCVGNTINLLATAPPKGGPFTYLWSGPQGFTSSIANPTITNPTNLAAGLYTVKITSTTLNPNRSIFAQTNVVVNSGATTATPTVTLIHPSCTVATGTITITSPLTGNGMTYSINGLTYTNTTGVFTAVAPGNYSVTAKNSSGCISSPTAVTINAQPTTQATPTITSAIATCVSSGTSTINNYSNSNTYTFSPATAGITINSSGLISGMMSGQSYTVNSKNGTCISAESSSFNNAAILTTLATPTLNPKTLTCAATSFTADWTAIANATSYQLDVATDAAFTKFVTGYQNKPLGNVTSDVVTGLLPATIYYVQLRAVNSCTTSGNSATLTVSAPIKVWNGGWTQLGAPSTPPTANEIIIFAADYTSTGDLNGCSCEIKAGVKVTIGKEQDEKLFGPSPSSTLSIINALTVDNSSGTSITFENNTSLWQENDAAINKGEIIYKRKSSYMKDFDYTYWSSPVADQITTKLSPNTQYDKYYYFKNNGWWEAYKAPESTMQAGRGYIIRTPRAGTWGTIGPPASSNYEVVQFPYAQPVQFKGIPNNGLYEFAVDNPGLKNLIGNPYPSAIDAKEFLRINENILEGTIYFWTHNTAIQLASGIAPGKAGSGVYAYTSDDYAAYNVGTGGVVTAAPAPSPIDPNNPANKLAPSGMIAAGQSFMAKTKTTAASGQKVIFNNGMRVKANNTQFFKLDKNAKTVTSDRQRVWLNLTNTEGAFKQTLIGYAKGATNGYEDFYDGIINNSNSYVNFYSINDNKKLVIQGRAMPFEQTDTVPLGYSSSIIGVFSISIDAVDGDLTDQPIFIEDKETNTIHNLKMGPYKFNTLKGTFDQRFVLRYADKTLGSADLKVLENAIAVTIKSKQLQIHSSAEPIDKVFIYDLLGRELYKKERVNINELTVQNLNSSSQTLVVKVLLENGTIKTQKVIY